MKERPASKLKSTFLRGKVLLPYVATAVVMYASIQYTDIEEKVLHYKTSLVEHLQEKLTQEKVFKVSTIEVRGNTFIPSSVLVKSLELSSTASVWENFHEHARKIEEVPGVALARVDKKLPSTIVISVKESAPVVWVVRDGKKTMVTSDGDLVENLSQSFKEPTLPLLDTEIPQHTRRIGSGTNLYRTLQAVHYLQERNFPWVAQIASVKSGGQLGYPAYMKSRPDVTFLLPYSFEDKRMGWLEVTLQDFDKRFEGKSQPEIVDLRFANQIVVKYRGETPQKMQ